MTFLRFGWTELSLITKLTTKVGDQTGLGTFQRPFPEFALETSRGKVTYPPVLGVAELEKSGLEPRNDHLKGENVDFNPIFTDIGEKWSKNSIV